jgi:hypothetical protein
MTSLHRLRQAISGLGLRALLPHLVRRGGLPGLLAWLDGPAHPRGPPGDDPSRLAALLFRPRRVWPTTCLYRALGSYALLRSAGQRVRFLLGVRKAGEQLLAHAWLERDGLAVVGAPGPGEPFAVAYAWPADPPSPPRVTARVAGIERSPDAVLTELQDGTGVLLHLQTRFYFTLNATGVEAWRLLGDGPLEAAELSRRLAAAYPGTDPALVRADVDALLADLAGEALVARRG